MARIRGTAWAGDTQSGTDYSDTFTGSRTADEFYGQYGDDTIKGARGDDILCGDDGVDRLFGGRGEDYLDGGAGYGNRLEGGEGRDWLTSDMLSGNWSELVGGRQADVFDVGIDEYDSKLEAPGVRAWTDIRDFSAAQGDKLALDITVAPGVGVSVHEVIPFFDSNFDGRVDDADNAAAWDGRNLQVSTETATIVLWGVDHIDSSMLIA